MNRFTNILIAEDDSEDYNFLAEVLQKIAGDVALKISRVKNGLEFMAVVKKDPLFDIIFIDLNMPGFNGLHCLKFIKSRNNFAHVPVIIYSTSHYIKDIDACFKNDAHYYIVKPTSNIGLSDMLLKIFTSFDESLKKPVKENFVVRATEALGT